MIYQLLTLLSMFGDSVPDIQPAFPNFYQPHGQWTNFVFDNISNPDTTGFDFAWTVQDTTYNTPELSLNELHPMECEGVFEVTLTATHRTTGTVYERSMCTWVVWSYYPYPMCDEYPCTFVDVLNQQLTPPFSPYQYRVDCGVDSNCSGTIDVPDLLNVLTQ